MSGVLAASTTSGATIGGAGVLGAVSHPTGAAGVVQDVAQVVLAMTGIAAALYLVVAVVLMAVGVVLSRSRPRPVPGG